MNGNNAIFTYLNRTTIHVGTIMSQKQDDKSYSVRLRPVDFKDLPLLFEFQNDLESNKMASTHRQSSADFHAHWSKIFQDTSIVARAILANESLAGSVSSFQSDGLNLVGYWIGRDFWGRGIATQALSLLLGEVRTRPLHSRVAVNNAASKRVLEKCGFQEVCREISPATKRFVECEEVVMRLSE